MVVEIIKKSWHRKFTNNVPGLLRVCRTHRTSYLLFYRSVDCARLLFTFSVWEYSSHSSSVSFPVWTHKEANKQRIAYSNQELVQRLLIWILTGTTSPKKERAKMTWCMQGWSMLPLGARPWWGCPCPRTLSWRTGIWVWPSNTGSRDWRTSTWATRTSPGMASRKPGIYDVSGNPSHCSNP